jgi:hypothetical protein
VIPIHTTVNISAIAQLVFFLAAKHQNNPTYPLQCPTPKTVLGTAVSAANLVLRKGVV